MAQWPTGSVSKAHSDHASDDPAQWRTDLNTLVDKVNAMIAAFAQANGVCDLDANGSVPAARLGLALRVANNLNDVGDKETALSNLGGTEVGRDLFTADSTAAARNVIAVDQSGTSDATPSTLMKRDANGRSKVADPSADQDIVTKQYVDASSAFTGEMRIYGGALAPSGWLLCNGRAVSRTTYADLFAVIGTAYGAGDGSTTFNLPDFRSRMPIGVGQGPGLTYRSHGGQYGAESFTLAHGNMPTHEHSYSYRSSSGSALDHYYGSVVGVGVLTDSNTGSTGSGTAKAHQGPSLGVNFIIKT